MGRLRRIGLAFLGAIAVAGAIVVTHGGSGELDTAPRNRLGGRSRSRIATGGWDAALRLLNPPGAGYDSTNISLSTASGGAVTFTSATPRQYCPDSSGALRALAANKPCVVDGLALKVRPSAANNLTAPTALSDAAWTKTNVTLGSDATLAPDGTTAAKVSATASAATTIVQGAAVAATSASCLFWIKKGSGATDANTFQLRNSTTATALVLATINYDTLAISHTTGSGSSATQYANGWIRLVLQASAGITSGNTVQCYPFFTGAAETAGEYAYFFGADLVPGTTTPGDFCAASAGTCSAETATVATPATLSRTEGCVCMNINPGWTGTFPFGTTAYYARGNAGATVRFAYTSNGADTFQAYDGTNIASVAAGHTIGTRKRYCTRWSAAGNFLRVENIAAGTSNSQAFTTFPAFDPSITTVDANALIDSIVFGRSPLACQ